MSRPERDSPSPGRGPSRYSDSPGPSSPGTPVTPGRWIDDESPGRSGSHAPASPREWHSDTEWHPVSPTLSEIHIPPSPREEHSDLGQIPETPGRDSLPDWVGSMTRSPSPSSAITVDDAAPSSPPRGAERDEEDYAEIVRQLAEETEESLGQIPITLDEEAEKPFEGVTTLHEEGELAILFGDMYLWQMKLLLGRWKDEKEAEEIREKVADAFSSFSGHEEWLMKNIAEIADHRVFEGVIETALTRVGFGGDGSAALLYNLIHEFSNKGLDVTKLRILLDVFRKNGGIPDYSEGQNIFDFVCAMEGATPLLVQSIYELVPEIRDYDRPNKLGVTPLYMLLYREIACSGVIVNLIKKKQVDLSRTFNGVGYMHLLALRDEHRLSKHFVGRPEVDVNGFLLKGDGRAFRPDPNMVGTPFHIAFNRGNWFTCSALISSGRLELDKEYRTKAPRTIRELFWTGYLFYDREVYDVMMVGNFEEPAGPSGSEHEMEGVTPASKPPPRKTVRGKRSMVPEDLPQETIMGFLGGMMSSRAPHEHLEMLYGRLERKPDESILTWFRDDQELLNIVSNMLRSRDRKNIAFINDEIMKIPDEIAKDYPFAWEAALSGNIGLLQHALKINPKRILDRDNNFNTMLHAAAFENRDVDPADKLRVVKYILVNHSVMLDGEIRSIHLGAANSGLLSAIDLAMKADYADIVMTLAESDLIPSFIYSDHLDVEESAGRDMTDTLFEFGHHLKDRSYTAKYIRAMASKIDYMLEEYQFVRVDVFERAISMGFPGEAVDILFDTSFLAEDEPVNRYWLGMNSITCESRRDTILSVIRRMPNNMNYGQASIREVINHVTESTENNMEAFRTVMGHLIEYCTAKKDLRFLNAIVEHLVFNFRNRPTYPFFYILVEDILPQMDALLQAAFKNFTIDDAIEFDFFHWEISSSMDNVVQKDFVMIQKYLIAMFPEKFDKAYIMEVEALLKKRSMEPETVQFFNQCRENFGYYRRKFFVDDLYPHVSFFAVKIVEQTGQAGRTSTGASVFDLPTELVDKMLEYHMVANRHLAPYAITHDKKKDVKRFLKTCITYLREMAIMEKQRDEYLLKKEKEKLRKQFETELDEEEARERAGEAPRRGGGRRLRQ